ncbi:MAG: hypothetical protein OZ921_15135 [Sorangiineae bacterium]|nr:hypothetical protein [Polyangiaceae bacterium]MEB2323845.1 hypothetical protein [Sorangiineae bacterium]
MVNRVVASVVAALTLTVAARAGAQAAAPSGPPGLAPAGPPGGAPPEASAPPAAPQSQPSPSRELPPVEGSVGLRVLGGGNLFSTPGSVTPAGYEGLGFAGNGGGFGWGFGGYGELRFAGHLGLELGLLYDSSEIRRDVTYNRVVKVRERFTTSSVRLDLLVKGILPFPGGRVWAGLGPEFVLSSSADAKNEITEGKQYVGNASDIEGLIRADAKRPVLLALGLGMVIHAGELIEIPIDARALDNLSQEDAWRDRVALQMNGPNLASYTVSAENTWEFRLGIGIGARF